MPSSPPTVSPFSLLPPLPSPSYSFFCPPRSLGLRDVRPHPSMRGGAVVAVCQTWGPSKGGDMATVRDGDVAWLVGVGVGDEHALA